MTIDDESSVYVGGLPYDATESSIRRLFSLYGAVVAVKSALGFSEKSKNVDVFGSQIVNDHTTRGKCYGFVTFTNPRSAYDAISDMNGKTVDGRVVRVNEVTTRGGRSNFSRDRSRRSERDRRRDRERDHDRDRERYRDRYSDRSGEHDRSRDHDSGRGRGYVHHDHDREYSLDRDHDRDVEDNVQGESRDHIQDWERGHEMNLDEDREIAGTNGFHRSDDEDKEQQLRRWNGSMSNDQHGRGLSSDSSDDYNQMKKDLERSTQSREELKTEISLMEGKLEERQQIVLDLQKKSKLHKCFLQVTEYREKLKSCEQELQSLVDSAMVENEDDVAVRGGSLANGIA
ncbi:hypothetical protein REPUB_Repub18cG0085800 [Reevesia pubescens]